MITIGGLDMNPTNGYLVEEVTYKNTPKRNLISQGISRRPGDKIIANEWKNKEINIKGRIFGASNSALMSNVDSLQLAFSTQSLALSIDTGRTYTATLDSLDIPTQFYNNAMVEFDATFIAYDPFAYASQVSASGVVTSGTVTFSGSLTVSGTVFAYPKLTIYPKQVGIQGLKFTHTPTGETLTISGSFTALSPLVIDFDNFLFTNNGTNTDYLGIFSRFDVGSVGYSIQTISGTNAGFNYVWQYSPRYFQ